MSELLDPNASTSAVFNCKAFVGLSAGAAVATLRDDVRARDTSIASADVRTMFGLLRAPHELDIYPEAGHAFFDDTRPSYVATAAADAWTKTPAWFRRYLA